MDLELSLSDWNPLSASIVDSFLEERDCYSRGEKLDVVTQRKAKTRQHYSLWRRAGLIAGKVRNSTCSFGIIVMCQITFRIEKAGEKILLNSISSPNGKKWKTGPSTCNQIIAGRYPATHQ